MIEITVEHTEYCKPIIMAVPDFIDGNCCIKHISRPCPYDDYFFQYKFEYVKIRAPRCFIDNRRRFSQRRGPSDKLLIIDSFFEYINHTNNTNDGVDSINNSYLDHPFSRDKSSIIEWVDGERYRWVDINEFIEYDFDKYFNENSAICSEFDWYLNRNIEYLIKEFDIVAGKRETELDALKRNLDKNKIGLLFTKFQKITNSKKRLWRHR